MDTVIWAANNYLVLKIATVIYVAGCAYAIYKFHQLRKSKMAYKCGKCGIKFNSQAQAKCSRCKPAQTAAMPTPYAKAYARPVPPPARNPDRPIRSQRGEPLKRQIDHRDQQPRRRDDDSPSYDPFQFPTFRPSIPEPEVFKGGGGTFDGAGASGDWKSEPSSVADTSSSSSSDTSSSSGGSSDW